MPKIVLEEELELEDENDYFEEEEEKEEEEEGIQIVDGIVETAPTKNLQEPVIPPSLEEVKQGRITREQRAAYKSIKKDLLKKDLTEIPSGYLFMHINSILNNNLPKNPKKAIDQLLSLYKRYPVRDSIVKDMARYIGDIYLLLGEKEKAITWYLQVESRTLTNYSISYYNYEKGLKEMPLTYWRKIFQGIAQDEKSFLQLLLFLDQQTRKDTNKSLLDFLQLKEKKQISYKLFQGSSYKGEKRFLLDPYQDYTSHKKTEEVFSSIYSYFCGKKELQNIIRDKAIPRRLRYYISYYLELEQKKGVIRKDKKKRGRAEKRERIEEKRATTIRERATAREKKKRRAIQLNEERIKRAIEEQKETAAHFQSLFQEDREDKRESSAPLIEESNAPIDLEDIFSKSRENTPPELSPDEREILSLFIQKTMIEPQELRHILSHGVFPNQAIDDLNSRVYDYLGDILIEEENNCWALKEEHREAIEEMGLSPSKALSSNQQTNQ